MAKDAARRKPKSYARNEESKETGSRDYHLCDSAGKPTSDCGQAMSSAHQYWLETEPNPLLKLEPILHNMSKRGEKLTSKALLPQEIREAEDEVVRSCQREAFSNEYKALKSGKPIPPKSQLIQLSPVLDEEGCIRSNGRLQFAEYLPYDVRFLKVLPQGHWVTKLIVKHYHEQANHTAGTNFVLSQVSEKYWIVAAREEIREWERECNMCK